MKKKLGGKCKMYMIAAAFTAAPGDSAFPTGTATEFNRVIEVSIDDAKEMADASDRSSDVDQEEAVGRKVSVDVKIHCDPESTQYLALVNAYRAGTPLALAFYTGPKEETPGEGFAANWTIASKGREEKRKEFVVVTFKLGVQSFYGDYVVAAGGGGGA